MKSLALTSALIALCAPVAQAQSVFSGGEISLTFADVQNPSVPSSYREYVLSGRGLLQFDALDLQVDGRLAHDVFAATTSTASVFGLHASRALGNGLRGGVYATYSNPSGFAFVGGGIEGQWQAGGFSAEAYLGAYRYAASTPATRAGLALSYDTASGLGLFAGVNHIDYHAPGAIAPVTAYDYGLSYQFGSAPLRLSLSQKRWAGSSSYSTALTVSYALGGGSDGLFAARDHN